MNEEKKRKKSLLRGMLLFVFIAGYTLMGKSYAFADQNTAPTQKNPLPVIALRSVSEKTWDADLVAEDEEGDRLTIEKIVLLPDEKIAAVSLENGEITTKAVGLGSTEIEIMVSDGVESTKISLEIKVLPALSVYEGEVLKKEFLFQQLVEIAEQEGEKVYSYSGYNNYPTAKYYEKEIGPTIQGVLNTAYGTLVTVAERDLLSFVAPDRYQVNFTGEQLLKRERYFFPQIREEKKPVWSMGGGKKAKKGAVVVPAILSLSEGGNLRFGQEVPSEQNTPLFNSGMASGGKIILWKNGAKKNPYHIQKASKKNKTVVKKGEVIKFTEPAVGLGTAKLYYTIGFRGKIPEEPTLSNSQLINISTFQRGTPIADAWPVLKKEGVTTIKVRYLMNGFLDGETTTFTYRVKK